MNIQTYLQARFLAMYEQLVRATGDIPGVLGFEVRPLRASRKCG